jgi:dynein heavy chain 1
MTLLSTLQSLEGVIVASLSFSSKTSPDIILKIFRQYCVFKKRGKDLMLEPSESFGHNSWLIIFCDEINLPENDHYGTQRVISFMRQLIEHGGFWREDNTWVRISRIQFVGACNPPSDAGRVIMSPRFLRYAPLIYLDFPSKESLLQIYGTFNGGITRLFPHLKAYTKSLTEAMVDLYLRMQERFTSSNQPHYFFSPRELTRWVRGIYGAVKNLDSLDREDLVRLWAHEALRLFSDRLVEEADKDWCSQTIDEVATSHFIGLNFSEALARPILFSSWLSKDMHSVSKDALTDYIENRLRIFYEEELDVSLVLFDDVIEHMLRVSVPFIAQITLVFFCITVFLFIF